MTATHQKAKDAKALFSDLGLADDLLQTLNGIGFKHPTPIQERSIPKLLAGHDVIGQARTGTGKTAAFGLPMLEKLDPSADDVQCLILAPTRELAIQIADELERYSGTRKLRLVRIYGGTPYESQEKALSDGVNVVVGTPGRIMDHMERGNLDLRRCRMLILDEADRMLDMGFLEDVEWILKHMPSKHARQTMLFSATMPEEIKQLTRRFMLKPEYVRVSQDELTVPLIDQSYFALGRRNKLWGLLRVIDSTPDMGLMMVFCATKSMCDRLTEDLQRHKFDAEALHGDLNQARREKVLEKFEQSKQGILVATDVAARGLDIRGVTHVVNWDLPEKEIEAYVHRIGRTGRAGNSGEAISFVSPEDSPTLKRIEMLIGKPIPKREPPHVDRDRVRRVVDWEEFADNFGYVHIQLDAGRKSGLTRFRLHDLVRSATNLEDQCIKILHLDDVHATISVPKDAAVRAIEAIRHTRIDGEKIAASFGEQP